VRHFYYRLIKKMNVLLEAHGIQVLKSNKYQVRDAIVFWYQLFQPIGKLTTTPLPGKNPEAESLVAALASYLKARPAKPNLPRPLVSPPLLLPKGQSDSPTSLRRASKETEDSTLLPMDPLRRLVCLSSSEGKKAVKADKNASSAPKRIVLQLVPKNEKIAQQLIRAGYNPLLQLTFSSKKPISYIVQHMAKKWMQEIDGTQVRVLWPSTTYNGESNVIRSGSRSDRTHSIAPC